MAEAWDTQGGDFSSACSSWDCGPYVPFQYVDEKSLPNEVCPPQQNESTRKREEDETLKTALEWVRNSSAKHFPKDRRKFEPDDRNHFRSDKTWTNPAINGRQYDNRTANCISQHERTANGNHRGSREFHERFDRKNTDLRHSQETYGCGRGERHAYSRNPQDERRSSKEKYDNRRVYKPASNGEYLNESDSKYQNYDNRNSRGSYVKQNYASDRGHRNARGNWKPNSSERKPGNSNFSQSNVGNRGYRSGRGNWKQNNCEREPRNSNDSQDKVGKRDENERIRYPVGIRKLQSLVKEDKEEILLFSISSTSGFQLLLKEKNLTPDIMALVLEVLSKASDSNQSRSVVELFRMISDNRNFTMLVMRYVLHLNSDQCKDHHIEALSHFLWYLLSFQRALPALGSDYVQILLPLIKDNVNKLFEADKLDNFSVLDIIAQLERENVELVQKTRGYNPQVLIQEEEASMKPPPNDFRSLSIFPSKDDVEDLEPFIRPIVTAGGYSDVEHYLDVQFRLLREDFVRPLREGIIKYKQSLGNKRESKNISGIHVYKDVHILFPRCTLQGIHHSISFNISYFKNFNWEANKRLLPGSLVCLSSNNFKSMLFAEVVLQDIELLSQGMLDIRFDSIDDSIMKLRPSETFVMLETSAYFEAYKHNLKKLQTLNEASLPLSEFIIKVNRNIGSPRYLTSIPRIKYDLRPLMLPFPDINAARIVMQDSAFYNYDFPGPLSNGKEVEIFKESSWPPCHELNVDVNQYCALQAALTKELVVIQGPPGTGKTFIGLRIIQTLLHNRDVWRKHSDTPILIVCYTNHALDQFLEGILTFTTSLVRIGGKCSSERLDLYKLFHLRRERRMKKLLPISMTCSMYDCIQNLKGMKSQVDRVEKVLRDLKHTVLTEQVLEPHMEEKLVESLRMQETYSTHKSFDDGKLILDWLEVRVQGNFVPKWLRDEELTVEEIVGETHEFDDTLNREVEFYEVDVSRIVDEDDKEFTDIVNGKIEESAEDKDEEADAETGGAFTFVKKKRYIEMQLKKTKMMTAEKIEEVKDVWSLTPESRWSLYQAWVARYARAKLESIVFLVKQYQEELLRYQELQRTEDLNILRSACVVGMTTTGAAKYEALVSGLHPKIVMVEEAAEVFEAHIITSLSKDTQQLILIGDHQQLRPNPTMHELAEKYNLSISLFERLVNNNIPCQKLITQHRMRTSIRRLLTPHIYPKLIDHSSVKSYGHIKGLAKNVFFIDHKVQDTSEMGTNSLFNVHEAKFLIALCKYLIMQDYKPSQITILATYSKQTFLIQKMADKNAIMTGVHITSVDNYQGNENDIVLISFVRSNEEGYIGFLKVSNRVCVALSRARKGLYCIGNFQLLAENSELWKNITTHLETKNAIGSALQLLCQIHPEVTLQVSVADDFAQSPEGGCTKLCQHRLEKCGHRCPRVCHPYDREHKTYRCMEKCGKKPESCNKDHRCKKKCSECTEKESCGNCIANVVVKLPCEHVVKVPCFISENNVSCPVLCQRFLKCGHKCKNTCGEVCTVSCHEAIDCTSPCGHKIKIECCFGDDKHELMTRCTQKCTKELECGHLCPGTCKSCFQGRFHQRCRSICNRILVCGHPCSAFCSLSCPPCRKNCENRCAHSRCSQQCGHPCKECNMQCVMRCPHKMCSNLCWEICNIEPCLAPCNKRLQCGHPCVGLCGDPCPKWCRVCNRKELLEALDIFGAEASKNSRFVQLEECGDVFEIKGMGQWMETFKEGPIRLPCCPRCQRIIWMNMRFSAIIKLCQTKIAEVKKQVFGILGELHEEQLRLKKKCERLDKELEPNVCLLVHRCFKVLNQDTKLDSGMIATLRNILNFLETISGYFSKFLKMTEFMNVVRIKSKPLFETVKKIQHELIFFILQVLKQEDQFTQQQLFDTEREMVRLRLLFTLIEELKLNTEGKVPSKEFIDLFEVAFKVLTNSLYLSEDDISLTVKPVIQTFRETRGGLMLDVTDEEKVQIVKAVGLSQGHWYQCGNGHVYCIDRCGGPMEESKCPECDSKIGGMDHKLLPGNTFANEMDGAEFPAFSNEANLANFDPAQLEEFY